MMSVGMLLFSCNLQDDNSVPTTSLSSFSKSGYNFSLHLTDAPNDNLLEVVVNIKRVLLKVNDEFGGGEIDLAMDVGQVDLLTLQNGKLLGLTELDLPIGSKINQIKLELYENGNYITYDDGSFCDLQTPSAQQSGLKLISPDVEIKEDQQLSFVVDFDAKKSIVHKGNGGCLLKPVLRWGGITSKDVESEDEEVIVENGDDGTGDNFGDVD